MRYFKYLVLALIVSLVSTSCEKDAPEYNWDDADYSKAFVQVYYMSLVNSTSANNIKYITINGTEYSYDHQSMISPYNFAPSAVVGSSYQTTAGKCTIKLETESGTDEATYKRQVVYEGTTEVDLKPGVVSQVIVWDNNEYDAEGNLLKAGAAPKVIEFGTPTIYNEVDSTGNSRFASARLYNFMFDAPGKPTEARLFFDIRRKSNGEIYATYPNDGVGLAFGEATDYFTTILWEDQILGASGYIYVRQDIRAVWPVGSELYPDGKEEILLKNDYWTTYMGRSYHYFYRGCYDGSVVKKTLTRFGAK